MRRFIPIILALFLPAGALLAASLYDIPLRDIDGKDTSLKPYKGKVLLVVNVASRCGLTPQYAVLQQIHEKYRDKGFSVLAFPCNQFGKQEPGTNTEIKEFCSSKFNVDFPMFDKIEVNGPNRHALYDALAGKASPFSGDIGWNFAKFLVGKDGKILQRFEPRTSPDHPQVTKAIESAVAVNASEKSAR